MFNLLSKRPNMKCHVSDLNSDLILAYVAIRDKVTELIESLENHSKKYQKNTSQYYYQIREPEPISLQNPLGDTTSVPLIIGRVIKVILGVLGTMALFVFCFGAFHWVTSAGYPQRVQTGTKTMIFAVAGMFVVFAAYGILSMLFEILAVGG